MNWHVIEMNKSTHNYNVIFPIAENIFEYILVTPNFGNTYFSYLYLSNILNLVIYFSKKDW